MIPVALNTLLRESRESLSSLRETCSAIFSAEGIVPEGIRLSRASYSAVFPASSPMSFDQGLDNILCRRQSSSSRTARRTSFFPYIIQSSRRLSSFRRSSTLGNFLKITFLSISILLPHLLRQ